MSDDSTMKNVMKAHDDRVIYSYCYSADMILKEKVRCD